MFWHPLTLTLVLCEVISVLIYVGAAGRLLWILPAWRGNADDSGQADRERDLVKIGYQGAWAALIQALGFALLLAGISNLWPAYVPGAMCGMGVMQALGAPALHTLFFKALTLLVFYCWCAACKIEGRWPQSTAAAGYRGRVFLLAAPFMFMGAWSLAKALAGAQSTRAVSCCAAVYDSALGLDFQAGGLAPGSGALPPLCAVAAAVALVWAWRLGFQTPTLKQKIRLWPAMVIWAALPVIYLLLTRVTAPYILEVLYHPCPWCLLLLEHKAVGIALFGLPAWVAAQSLVVAMAGHMARQYPILTAAATHRVRQAGQRMLAATVVFIVLAAAPSLWWVARFGDWIR